MVAYIKHVQSNGFDRNRCNIVQPSVTRFKMTKSFSFFLIITSQLRQLLKNIPTIKMSNIVYRFNIILGT